MSVWAERPASASRGTHQDPACHAEALRARHAFCLPLPTGVPGTLGWLHVHARGMDPARHLRLAARRAQYHWQGAPRCRFLAFQGGASCQWRARRGAQHDTEGIEPYEKRGPLIERRTPALARGIAAVGHDDIPWSQGARLAPCPGVDIADHHRAKLQGHQGHREVQAMIGAGRPWGLHTARVAPHPAPRRGQGRPGGHGEHLP